MDKRRQHVRVGVFVLATLGLLFALGTIAMGSRLGESRVRYLVQYHETVKGMVRGSPVNFQGVQIGAVSDIRFVGGITEVTIDVDPELAPIQTVTRASLDRAWVTGQVTVELGGWEKGGDPLPEYGTIPASLSAGAVVMRSLPEVMGRVTEILEEFEGVAKRLNRVLEPDSVVGDARGLLADLRGTATRLNRVLSDDNIARVSTLLADAEAGVAELRRETLPHVTESLRAVSAVAKNLERLSAVDASGSLASEANALMADLRKNLPPLTRVVREVEGVLRGNRHGISKTIDNLAGALQDMRAVARMLQRAPSALLFGKSKTGPDAEMRELEERARSAPPPASTGGR